MNDFDKTFVLAFKYNSFLKIELNCDKEYMLILMNCLVYHYRYGPKFYSWLPVFLKKAQSVSNYQYEPKLFVAGIFLTVIFLLPSDILVTYLYPAYCVMV